MSAAGTIVHWVLYIRGGGAEGTGGAGGGGWNKSSNRFHSLHLQHSGDVKQIQQLCPGRLRTAVDL